MNSAPHALEDQQVAFLRAQNFNKSRWNCLQVQARRAWLDIGDDEGLAVDVALKLRAEMVDFWHQRDELRIGDVVQRGFRIGDEDDLKIQNWNQGGKFSNILMTCEQRSLEWRGSVLRGCSNWQVVFTKKLHFESFQNSTRHGQLFSQERGEFSRRKKCKVGERKR